MRTSAYLLLLLVACSKSKSVSTPDASSALSPVPTRHDWGEDPKLVPSWALPQERRAPKMPAGDERWKELEAPASFPDLTQGLLVCRVAVSKRGDTSAFRGWGTSSVHLATGNDWDTLAGPDTLFRFQFGSQRPISLWGPEDHWELYISIPRVTLHSGDSTSIDVWDRDGGEDGPDEYIGTIKTAFDGHFPWIMDGPHLHLECHARDEAGAHEWASPWRDKIDAALMRIDQATVNDREDRFAEPAELTFLKESLRFYNDVNFRYYAGFLGWEDPEVEQRLTHFLTSEVAWREKVSSEMTRLAGQSPPLGEWQNVREGWSARVTNGSCPGCYVLETRAASKPAPACPGEAGEDDGLMVGGYRMVFVGEQGNQEFAQTPPGTNAPCSGSTLTVRAPSLSPKFVALLGNQMLFWNVSK